MERRVTPDQSVPPYPGLATSSRREVSPRRIVHSWAPPRRRLRRRMEYDYERVRRELGSDAALEAAVRDVRSLAAENRRLLAQLNACTQRLATCEDRLTTAAAHQAAQLAEIDRLVQSRNDWQQAAQLWESNARSLLEELRLYRGRSHEPPRRP